MNLDHGCTMAVKCEFLGLTKEDVVESPTYLHVQGVEQLYTAIKSCFASYYNSKLITSRIQNNGGSENKLVIIVQKMIFQKNQGLLH